MMKNALMVWLCALLLGCGSESGGVSSPCDGGSTDVPSVDADVVADAHESSVEDSSEATVRSDGSDDAVDAPTVVATQLTVRFRLPASARSPSGVGLIGGREPGSTAFTSSFMPDPPPLTASQYAVVDTTIPLQQPSYTSFVISWSETASNADGGVDRSYHRFTGSVDGQASIQGELVSATDNLGQAWFGQVVIAPSYYTAEYFIVEMSPGYRCGPTQELQGAVCVPR